MSHTNHRRKKVTTKRRKALPEGGRRSCLCHDTEGRQAAERKSGRKRKGNRTARRRLKENLVSGKNRTARQMWSWPNDLKKEVREGSD